MKIEHILFPSVFFKITDLFNGRSFLMCSQDPFFGTNEITPYNVGSVLWRLFSTLEVVQYIGGITSVLWGDNISTVGDNISTVEVAQYSGG